VYNSDIIHSLSQARRVISRLTQNDFESLIPKEYHRELIKVSRSVAQKALSAFSRRDLKNLHGEAAFEVSMIHEILGITDPVLMASDDYLDDHTTIVELWCFSTDTYEHHTEVPIMKTPEGNFVVFSLGESGGPVSCSKCKEHAWLIFIPEEEYNQMPYKKGTSGGLRYVTRHRIGEARCKKHMPKESVTPTT
jgi:hypothetical protein